MGAGAAPRLSKASCPPQYGADGATVRIGLDESDDSVGLWVADRGSGIPAHLREEALRKYRRLDQARAMDGSGLGLALVRAVARLHGGELILEDYQPGLRAVLRLPRTEGTVAGGDDRSRA